MEGSIVSTLEAIVGQVLRLGTSDLQDPIVTRKAFSECTLGLDVGSLGANLFDRIARSSGVILLWRHAGQMPGRVPKDISASASHQAYKTTTTASLVYKSHL